MIVAAAVTRQRRHPYHRPARLYRVSPIRNPLSGIWLRAAGQGPSCAGRSRHDSGIHGLMPAGGESPSRLVMAHSGRRSGCCCAGLLKVWWLSSGGSSRWKGGYSPLGWEVPVRQTTAFVVLRRVGGGAAAAAAPPLTPPGPRLCLRCCCGGQCGTHLWGGQKYDALGCHFDLMRRPSSHVFMSFALEWQVRDFSRSM